MQACKCTLVETCSHQTELFFYCIVFFYAGCKVAPVGNDKREEHWAKASKQSAEAHSSWLPLDDDG